MSYKFNFDLTRIPKELFDEAYQLISENSSKRKINSISKNMVKKYNIDKNLEINNSEAIMLVKDIIDVQINNKLLNKYFKKTKNRALFLPHCCRKFMDSNCKASFKSETSSYECNHCSDDCIVSQATKYAKIHGYDVYILPGASCISKIFNKQCYEGIVGIACMDEIKLAKKSLFKLKIPSQAVPLLKNGCSNTFFNLNYLIEIFNSN
jgi:hypothetical protein